MTIRLWEERLVQQVENQPKRMLKALVNMQYLFFWNEIVTFYRGTVSSRQNESMSHVVAL